MPGDEPGRTIRGASVTAHEFDPSDARARLSGAWAKLCLETQREMRSDLHDVVGPTLAALRLNVKAARTTGDLDALSASVEKGVAVLESFAAKLRQSSTAPLLASAGLADALCWLAAQVEVDCGAVVAVVDELGERPIPLHAGMVLYAYAQAALLHYAKSPRNVGRIRVFAESARAGVELVVANTVPALPDPNGFEALFSEMRGSVSARVGERELCYQVTLEL